MKNMLQYYSQKYNMAGQTSSFRTLQKIGENLAKRRAIYTDKPSSKYSSNRRLHSKNTSQLSFITLDNSILQDSEKPPPPPPPPRKPRMSEKRVKKEEAKSKAIEELNRKFLMDTEGDNLFQPPQPPNSLVTSKTASQALSRLREKRNSKRISELSSNQ